MNPIIFARLNEEPSRFAAAELARYLTLCTQQNWRITDTPNNAATIELRNAVDADIPGLVPAETDTLAIIPRDDQILISGSNPRSILFAVYRYLQHCGCRWIRPGKEGEIIPRLTRLPLLEQPIMETADYPFRTICIEGACSVDHVRDLIDWATRHNMNGYFIQFEHGAHFLKAWYTHDGNPYLPGNPDFNLNDAAQLIEQQIIPEIKQRGLQFERVGHGWTCRVIGVPGEGWDAVSPELNAEQQDRLAEINGERKLFHGVALNTNLCYGNPAVRDRMATEIETYAEQHPEVDLLHIWLADGCNNQCECPACRDTTPADFYVAILNDVDARLTRKKLDTRLVFLIYVDLLWPPEKEQLHNPARFVLMFAPITRSFAESFAEAPEFDGKLSAYRRNKLEFPRDVSANIAFLRKWQNVFDGDGFDFDYHLLWASFYDLSQINLARVLHHDIQFLDNLGLKGLNSCQVQRLSFPHNLLLKILARTLWNRKLDFDTIKRETFREAFGATDGQQAEEFCTRVSERWTSFFNPVFVPETDRARINAGLENLPLIRRDAEEFSAVTARNTEHPEPAIRRSWHYLESWRLLLLDHLLPFFNAYLQSDQPAARQHIDALRDELQKQEADLHPALDNETMIRVLEQRVHEIGERT